MLIELSERERQFLRKILLEIVNDDGKDEEENRIVNTLLKKLRNEDAPEPEQSVREEVLERKKRLQQILRMLENVS